LDALYPDALAAWGVENPADLGYRVELSRRMALAFDDSDQIILLEDIALVIPESQRGMLLGLRCYDRSLLSALWLSSGFRSGGKIIVYSPPNAVELSNYLKLKKLMEERLSRSIPIQVLYEDEKGQLLELIQIFESNPKKYTEICETFAQRSPNDFHSDFHVQALKRHMDQILQGVNRSFVFPYEMTEFHRQEFQSYSDRLKFPDAPDNDKAKHNFFLRSQAFTALPKLVAAAPDGTVISNYEQYNKAIEHIDPIHTENTSQNIRVNFNCLVKETEAIFFLMSIIGICSSCDSSY
jgi:hypothetical protein